MPAKDLRNHLEGDFSDEVDKALEHATIIRESESELLSIAEQTTLLAKLAPLGIEVELLASTSHIDMFVA